MIRQAVRDSQRLKKRELAKMILVLVAASGMVITLAALPGLARLLPRLHRKRYSADTLRKTIYRLDKRGCIAAEKINGGYKIFLTPKGREVLENYELRQEMIRVPKKWDEKWRILIFDIEEERRRVRDSLRSFLRFQGFKRLQDSAWVHPYECKEVMELLRTKCNVRHQALYLRAEHIDGDRWLRKEFGLK